MVSKLNKNAQKWVEALESGEYEQGKGQLKYRKPHEKTKYCCLGVACEVYSKENKISRDSYLAIDDKGVLKRTYMFGERSATLPEEVCRWLGLRTDLGSFCDNSLIDLNDDDENKSFKEIAKIIRSKPKGLFVRKGKHNG